MIFESEVNVPSAFSANDPDAPFTVKTASEGSDTPTSCSRTLTVAADALVTVHADAAVLAATVVVGTVVGVALAVSVAVGALVVAAPPQAAPNATARTRTIRLVMGFEATGADEHAC